MRSDALSVIAGAVDLLLRDRYLKSQMKGFKQKFDSILEGGFVFNPFIFFEILLPSFPPSPSPRRRLSSVACFLGLN